MNQNLSHDQKPKHDQTSKDQTQPPQEGGRVQQSLVDDKGTSATQQAPQNPPLKKRVQMAADSEGNQGNSSSELWKTQSVQSLAPNTGNRDSCKTRTGASPDWTGKDLSNVILMLGFGLNSLLCPSLLPQTCPFTRPSLCSVPRPSPPLQDSPSRSLPASRGQLLPPRGPRSRNSPTPR